MGSLRPVSLHTCNFVVQVKLHRYCIEYQVFGRLSQMHQDRPSNPQSGDSNRSVLYFEKQPCARAKGNPPPAAVGLAPKVTRRLR